MAVMDEGSGKTNGKVNKWLFALIVMLGLLIASVFISLSGNDDAVEEVPVPVDPAEMKIVAPSDKPRDVTNMDVASTPVDDVKVITSSDGRKFLIKNGALQMGTPEQEAHAKKFIAIFREKRWDGAAAAFRSGELKLENFSHDYYRTLSNLVVASGTYDQLVEFLEMGAVVSPDSVRHLVMASKDLSEEEIIKKFVLLTEYGQVSDQSVAMFFESAAGRSLNTVLDHLISQGIGPRSNERLWWRLFNGRHTSLATVTKMIEAGYFPSEKALQKTKTEKFIEMYPDIAAYFSTYVNQP